MEFHRASSAGDSAQEFAHPEVVEAKKRAARRRKVAGDHDTMHHTTNHVVRIPRHARRPIRRGAPSAGNASTDSTHATTRHRRESHPGGANARMRGGALALRAPCARVAWRRRDVRRATRRVSSANGDVWPAVSVRRMRPDDLPAVIEIPVDASDPAEASAAALASYAREAVVASPREERALVAETAEDPLEPREVVGVVGVLMEDRLKPPGDATGRREHRLRAQRPRRRREGATKRRRQGAPPRRRACAPRAPDSKRWPAAWTATTPSRAGCTTEAAIDPSSPRNSSRSANSWRPSTRFAGVAHAVDLLVGPSALPAMVGAPAWGPWTPRRDSPPRRAARRTRRPPPNVQDAAVAVAGLVAYGLFEVALAGVRGGIRRRWGTPPRPPSPSKPVVFTCYRVLTPGPQRGRVNLGKSLRASTTTTTPPPRKSDSSLCSWASANVRRPTVRPFCLRLPLRANVAAFRVTAATVRAAATGRDDVEEAESTGWRTSASAPPRTTREWKTDGWRSSPNPNRRSTSRRITSATIRVAWCTPSRISTTACGRRRRTVQGGRRHRRRASPPNLRAAQETIPRERRGVLRPGGGDDGASAGDNLRARHGGRVRVRFR